MWKTDSQNKIHALEFPKNTEKPENKKEIEYLYIEADEDHVSLQFRDKKVIWKKTRITGKTIV